MAAAVFAASALNFFCCCFCSSRNVRGELRAFFGAAQHRPRVCSAFLLMKKRLDCSDNLRVDGVNISRSRERVGQILQLFYVSPSKRAIYELKFAIGVIDYFSCLFVLATRGTTSFVVNPIFDAAACSSKRDDGGGGSGNGDATRVQATSGANFASPTSLFGNDTHYAIEPLRGEAERARGRPTTIALPHDGRNSPKRVAAAPIASSSPAATTTTSFHMTEKSTILAASDA